MSYLLDWRYLQRGAQEIRAWWRGPQRRTRAQVVREYTDWRVDLEAPALAIYPDGRLENSTIGKVRDHNWRGILEGLDELGVRAGTVLEVGAGDGTNLNGLRDLAPHMAWVGCDLVPRTRGLVACDAVRLPFPDRAFEAVITRFALEQMPREIATQALREIGRVSRLGLVSIEPDYQRAAWLQRLAMIRKDYIRDVIRPAKAVGLELLRHDWAVGGSPLMRPSRFVFRKRAPGADGAGA